MPQSVMRVVLERNRREGGPFSVGLGDSLVSLADEIDFLAFGELDEVYRFRCGVAWEEEN